MASNEDGEFEISVDPDYGNSEFFTSHKFEEMFSLFEILSIEDHTKKMEYRTNCEIPNTWEVVIQFEKQVPFNNFNLFVTLRRTDFMEHANEGILDISFLNIQGKKCPVSYRVKSIFQGRVAKPEIFAVDPHFNCLLREEDHLTLPDDTLVVRVELFVRGCCSHVIKEQPEMGEPTEEDKLKSILNQFMFCPKL